MPRKNSIKTYYENGFYHIYNRGVEKRDIFLDNNDYTTFLQLLKTALSDNPKRGSTPFETTEISRYKIGSYKRQNFHSKIDLLAYCLMPNHFHLLVRQMELTAITKFMRSVCTSYCMYFNKKYDRVGSLFQGIFKAVDIEGENYLLWLTRYIHRNPENFRNYQFSSYNNYLGNQQNNWLNTQVILDYFSSSKFHQVANFQKFVDDDAEEPADLGFLTIEET